MPEDDRELTRVVTRGFEGVHHDLKEREERVTKLSEAVIRVEGELKAVATSLNRLEGELSKSEHESIRIRVGTLERDIKECKDKQEDNDKWIRGLLISVIFLLIGVVTNFVMARLK